MRLHLCFTMSLYLSLLGNKWVYIKVCVFLALKWIFRGKVGARFYSYPLFRSSRIQVVVTYKLF